jgi:cytochrome c556
MTSARFPAILIAAAAIVAVAVATAAVAVHAQSTDRPASMPQMDHMPHMHDSAADPRRLVTLPVPMRQEMLASMRDHLQTLNAVVGDIANAKFDAASSLVEARLGLSSLPAHHAAELAPYFPAPMQQDGTMMHRAASRLAIALQDASVTRTFDAMRKVDAALGEVTSACVACHAAYRLR